MLNGKSITAIGFMPHTHLTGRQIYTKILNNGTETGYLAKNKYYDFNYQNTIFLDPFTNITEVALIFYFIMNFLIF